jgi:hypothetical protein
MNTRQQMEQEQENKRTLRGENVDDIVSKTADILSGGKTFGGWTDTTENYLKPSPAQLKKALARKNKSKSNVPLVKIGPDSSRPNPEYTKVQTESFSEDNDYTDGVTEEEILEVAPAVAAGLRVGLSLAKRFAASKAGQELGRQALGAAEDIAKRKAKEYATKKFTNRGNNSQ